MALYDLLSQVDADSYCILTSWCTIRRTLESFMGKGSWLPCKYYFYDGPRFTKPQAAKDNYRLSDKLSPGWLPRPLRPSRIPIVTAVISFLQISVVITRIVWTGLRVVRTENVARILALSDWGPALLASYIISLLTRKPYAVYLFDIYLGNRLAPAHKLLALCFEPLLVRSASVVIATNEEMEKLYRRRYGRTFKSAIIHNSIVSEPYIRKRTPYKPVPPYIITYTGLIYWAQERSLSNLIKAMNRLTDLPVRLDLYVPNADEKLMRAVKRHKNVRLFAADREKMPTVQCMATVLFLPLSWKTGNPDLIMTSSPGKLTEYLASGRPILVHAPPGTFVNNYARGNNLALVVDQESPNLVANAVRKLISDVQFARRLIGGAVKTFHRNHEALANAKRLADTLS